MDRENELNRIPLTFNPVFFRSYSRRVSAEKGHEAWGDMVTRVAKGLQEIGSLSENETKDIKDYLEQKIVFPAGRFLWVGGTEWARSRRNYYGLYNCCNIAIDNPDAFALAMDLSMQGVGVGAGIEYKFVNKLPVVRNKLRILPLSKEKKEQYRIGKFKPKDRLEITRIYFGKDKGEGGKDISTVLLQVGDSRLGWVKAYREVIALAFDEYHDSTCIEVIDNTYHLQIDLASVRPAGEPLKGFGGYSNPEKFPALFEKMAAILNEAQGRQLKPIECCKLIDEAALVVVAGSIRRSAGIRQGSENDNEFADAKKNLWVKNNGKWEIDPEKDCLRMANHSRVFHRVPSLQEVITAVTKQYHSGEGAIQYAPEAIARANADVLVNDERRIEFINAYLRDKEEAIGVLHYWGGKNPEHRIERYGLNPCFAAGTMIMTAKGHVPVENLIGKTVEIWDGNSWVEINNFRVTGCNKKIYKILLYSGQEIFVTDNHKFYLENGLEKQTNELKEGDRLQMHEIVVSGKVKVKGAYLKGFLIGDGSHIGKKPMLIVYDPKLCCTQKLLESLGEIEAEVTVSANIGQYKAIIEPGITASGLLQGLASRQNELIKWSTEYKKKLPVNIFDWEFESKLNFIAGYMDADGTALDAKQGFGYQISSVNLQSLRQFQLLLKTIGVSSKIALSKKGGLKDFGEKRGGVYKTKPLYRLTISQVNSIYLSQLVKFERLTSFEDKTTSHKTKSKENQVIKVVYSHVAEQVYCCTVPTTHKIGLSNGILTGQCGEIIGKNFLCNLSEVHANQLDPEDLSQQKRAFEVASIGAASLLNQKFYHDIFRESREIDPIIGISITGLFDFFVNKFGIEWLQWWQEGRQGDRLTRESFLKGEQKVLKYWRNTVFAAVSRYCERQNISVPNRFTTIQPAGSKSLLTGASPGWHPPKAVRYIRRITFEKGNPIALACRDLGYNIVPGQGDRDNNNLLLEDYRDPRVKEWLVEIPVAVPWADLPGAENIDPSKFSAIAQFDFFMQVQKYYVGHNTSATIEFKDTEIEELSKAIHKAIVNNEGYVSAALLARFDSNQTFPRLPFEPISKEIYQQSLLDIEARKTANTDDFRELLNQYSDRDLSQYKYGPAPCDSEQCSL
jgi:ribonucleotide reductase, class II